MVSSISMQRMRRCSRSKRRCCRMSSVSWSVGMGAVALRRSDEAVAQLSAAALRDMEGVYTTAWGGVNGELPERVRFCFLRQRRNWRLSMKIVPSIQ